MEIGLEIFPENVSPRSPKTEKSSVRSKTPNPSVLVKTKTANINMKETFLASLTPQPNRTSAERKG
jgi:hypothetical protein